MDSPSNRPFLSLSINPKGYLVTEFFIYKGVSSQKIGYCLASATRVVSNAMIQSKHLSVAEREQIEAEIAHYYSEGLREDWGEDTTTALV